MSKRGYGCWAKTLVAIVMIIKTNNLTFID
jgi:hypothetical protein